jgi:hypothetical protein
MRKGTHFHSKETTYIYICINKLQICAIPESNGIQTETAEMSLNLEYKERFSQVSYNKQAEEKLATTQSITETCLKKIGLEIIRETYIISSIAQRRERALKQTKS